MVYEGKEDIYFYCSLSIDFMSGFLLPSKDDILFSK